MGLTEKEVAEAAHHPDPIVEGDLACRVAQPKQGVGLLRIVFVEDGLERRILTLYWTSRVQKYWRGD